MALDTKGRFNIALADQGFILQGQPNTPSYVTAQAPVYGTRFASGDRDYNDLSQWWYLIQSDWLGGMKDTVSFEDDASYYYGSNVDTRTRPGTIRLERGLISYYTSGAANGNDEILHAFHGRYGTGSDKTFFVTNGDGLIDDNGSAAFSSTGSNSTHNGFVHRGRIWVIGSVVYQTDTFGGGGTSLASAINGIINGSIDEMNGWATVGNTLYLFGISTEDSLFCVKTTVSNPTTGADFSVVFEVPNHNNLGASVAGAGVVGDQIIVLVEGSPNWTLWALDIASGVVTFLKDFPGDQLGIYQKGGRYVTIFSGYALITVVEDSDTGKGTIWKYDGTNLTRLYKTDEIKYQNVPTTYEATAYLRGGGTVLGDYVYWGNLVFDGEHFFPFIKRSDDSKVYPLLPIGTDGRYLFVVDIESIGSQEQSIVYAYEPNAGTYKTDGFIVLSQHDKLQSIDKLLHNVVIGFDRLTTGQEIEVYYSTLPYPSADIADWTMLGEATYALDGGDVTQKTLSFPEGVNPKKVWFRINLKGSSSLTTPTVTDFTLEYLPVPDYRRQWVVNINCSDAIELLDGQADERTAREIAGYLEQLWLGKKVVEFQDVEYAATTLSASETLSATTLHVANTRDFPEAGRLMIGDEEILYSGKTPKTFTGCVRGRQGTVPAAHSSGATVSTGLFNVIITNYERRIPILQTDKKIESVVQLTLRETGVV